MQFEALKIYCDVVRWASFSRGAEENQISQSSASQAVRAIEERLGVKLIDRTKRPFKLTPQGKLYYDECKDLVGRYLEIETRVKGLENDQNVVGTVRVALIYSVGLHHMSQYVHTFGELYPGADVRLEFLHPTRVVESVSKDRAELGIVSFPKKWPKLTVIPWREEEMVLAVHPSHPLARRDGVSFSQLDRLKLVGFDSDLPIRRAIDRVLHHHKVQVQVVLEFDNIENIKRAVEIPGGAALLPEPTVAREVESGSLVALPIEGQDPEHRLTRPLAILHRGDRQLSLTASRFLKLLTTEDAGPLAASAATNGHLSHDA